MKIVIQIILRIYFFIYFFTFCCVALSSTADFAERPYWRVKTKVLNKIVDERDISVLVKSENEDKEIKSLIMNGGGAVKRSTGLVFAEVQKYHNLKKVSERIVEVQFDPIKNELFVHCEAFRYHARMWMTVQPEVQSDSGLRVLKFKVVRGHFMGMVGAFTFEEYRPQLTLMGFRAKFDYKTLPMPRFFVEFGLEVVLQKVAKDMRSFLENSTGL